MEGATVFWGADALEPRRASALRASRVAKFRDYRRFKGLRAKAFSVEPQKEATSTGHDRHFPKSLTT